MVSGSNGIWSNALNLNDCIQIMKDNVKNKYAQQYLDTIESAIDTDGTEGLKVQLLYILENSKGWRGEQAREVKKFIKKWIKTKNA